MKRRAVALVLAVLAVFGRRAFAQESAAPRPERPRLVVLCVVDQLASWVFELGMPHFAPDGGFRRLLHEGASFPKCAYEHACTETGPGHATIGTGVCARVHGIVRNQWWVRERNNTLYCVGEPMPALPDAPEGKNRGPGNLLAPTLATLLKAKSPASLAGSVSWKDRAAILMAGPKVDLAVWCEASTGHFVTNTAWAKATPDWLAAWNAKGEIDALFGTVWARSGDDAAFAGLVDDRPYELPHGNGTKQRTLPQPLTGGEVKPGTAFRTQVWGSPFGNTIVRSAAEAMVRGMHLGADATTDLLCVSFSSLDIAGHFFGADSVEARDTLLRLDRELGQFLAFLDEQVGAGKWALFLTADHGVGATPEWARAHGVDAGRGAIQTNVSAAAEKALREAFGAPPAGKRYVAHVGDFAVYLDESVLAAAAGGSSAGEVRARACKLVAEAAKRVRGIDTAFPTDELLAEGGAPDALRRSLVDALCPGRAGEVQLVLRPNWLDGLTPASHGTPHAYDREVVAIAVGPGVPAGAVIKTPITPGFGAVWFAQMLGLERPLGANDAVPAEFGAPW
jgi:hypothetical protein